MSKNDYISQLHRIICNSADVLPDKVINYLETLVNSGSYKVKKQIITEPNTYKLLIDYVPECFVDSILNFLIKKPIYH